MTPFQAQLSAVAKQFAGEWAHRGSAWDEVESQFRLRFPDDYRWLIESFGAFNFFNYFGIVSPFGGYSSLADFSTSRVNLIRARKHFASGMVDPDRTLIFAGDENGNFAGWEMIGNRNDWKIAYISMDALECVRFDVGLLPFLCGLLDGRFAFPFWDGSPIRNRVGPPIRAEL